MKRVWLLTDRMHRRTALMFVSMVLAVGGVMTGCNGGSTSTDPTDVSGAFVADEGSVGSIRLDVLSNRMSVSETSGFFVRVRNQAGEPVARISVACDTESGLALIEPSLGNELTDSSGAMSGIVGCERPGSFQVGCRLPIGANLRDFEDIVCEGDVPAGFAGFGDSAGGGGLGGTNGGVSVGDDGEPGGVGTDGIRIRRVTFFDEGSAAGAGTTAIDTAMGDCNEDPDEVECETFNDSQISIEVENDSNKSIRISGYNFTVPNAFGTGVSFTSKTLQFSPLEVAGFGGSEILTALFLEASGSDEDGDACSLGKRYPDASSNIPIDLGFRTVTFRVFGSNELGESVTLTATATASFGNVDRC